MHYRRLGRTGLQVSVLGMGGGYAMLLDREMGVRLYQRAFELGVTYYDGRYGDSSLKLAPVLKAHRERCVVATKTAESRADGVLQRIDEDLRELGTDYLDVFYLRCYTHDMLQERLAPGGAFEALDRARAAGKVRFVGLANHSDPSVLVAGIETGLVDVVLFPLNIVRREALDALIPIAEKHDVGRVVMKPLSVGKIPAGIGLRWLVTQPVHCIAPGVSSTQQLDADVAAVSQVPEALSAQEQGAVELTRAGLERSVCRICDEICQSVCQAGLEISWMIHHDVLYEHYRSLGLQDFLAYPLTQWARESIEAHFSRRLALAQACTGCGLCEERCPHGLAIRQMLDMMLEDHPPVIAAARERGWSPEPRDVEPPPWTGTKRERRS